MSQRIILTGATGMVGEGVLLTCLAQPKVEVVLSISRRPSGHAHPKLRDTPPSAAPPNRCWKCATSCGWPAKSYRSSFIASCLAHRGGNIALFVTKTFKSTA